MSLSRRQTLGLLAASGALACSPKPKPTPFKADNSANTIFLHGVASGDIQHTSLVIWTRISTASETVEVDWELASDQDFNTIIQTGTTSTNADKDFTVKVIPENLEAGSTYFYRFKALNATSPIGRTKTLPSGNVEKLGVALASCSNFAFGFFNAYDAIAKDEAIDVVLHTGDYIYEYGGDEGWGHETAKTVGRVHSPKHEIITLQDYRTRHAQYKTDAGSLAMHAAHPLLCIWDDHETANNPWMDGAQNHQPDTEGDYAARRQASIQAYYEWMPIREPTGNQTRSEAWRTYSFGDLATLITLETRHTGRSEQVDYLKHFANITSPETRDIFIKDVMQDPERKMISQGMEKALRDGLEASVSSNQPWRMLGNASPIARMPVPDVSKHGITPDMNKDPEGFWTKALFWKGKWNLPFYTDTWDGYPVARENLYKLAKSVGANDLLFLTGDSHSYWANPLKDADGNPAGIELGTAGISSPGDFVESGWPNDVAEKLDRIFEQELDEVKWTDNLHQGYVRVVFTPQSANADFVAVDNVLTTEYRVSTIHSEKIVHDGKSIKFSDI
ncbi:alkaline phosphatase D family protein [Hirschia litorea]|uniref:Alkaline phosphatase D family protein n=1 Tax=Hirschia litorea TaxID=1199156 RepID=A0ABW2IJY3_9PROT